MRREPRRPRTRAAGSSAALAGCCRRGSSRARRTWRPAPRCRARGAGRRTARRSPVGTGHAEEEAVVVDAGGVVEREEVGEGDDVALHPADLGDLGHPAGAVAHPGEVDDQVDRRRDLLADGPHRQVDAGHEHHGLEPGERVARRVGVQRRQRAVVARVHRLQHVERLGAADLADDDAVGPHAQRVADEVADRDLRPCPRCSAAGSRAGRRGAGVEPQLGGVLDRDDALVLGDEPETHVEQRRLAGAGAAADEDVEAAAHARLEQLDDLAV